MFWPRGFPVYRTDIQAVHIDRKGDLKLIQISDDQQKMILDLAKSCSDERFSSFFIGFAPFI